MVVVITLALLGLNIWGFYSLKQDYNENWFYPSDSYAYEYNEMKEKYFPGGGARGAVYCSKLETSQDFPFLAIELNIPNLMITYRNKSIKFLMILKPEYDFVCTLNAIFKEKNPVSVEIMKY